MPVELIGVPPVWVDQALELEAGTDVDGMWIDGMEEVVEGAGYVSELVLPINCCFKMLFTPLRVGWPPTPQVYFGP